MAAILAAQRVNFGSLVCGILIAIALMATSWLFGITIRRRLKRLTESAGLVAQGKLDVDMDCLAEDEIGRVSRSFAEIIQSLKGVTNELGTAINFAKAGDFTVSLNSRSLKGVYSDLVSGMQQTFDSASKPIAEAVAVLGKIAERDLRVRMEGDYSGSFDSIKQSLNAVVDV